MAGFVDVHSHAVSSGDDGARSIEEAVELCGLALAGGTRVLFATPHAHAAWDHYPLALKQLLTVSLCHCRQRISSPTRGVRPMKKAPCAGPFREWAVLGSNQ